MTPAWDPKQPFKGPPWLPVVTWAFPLKGPISPFKRALGRGGVAGNGAEINFRLEFPVPKLILPGAYIPTKIIPEAVGADLSKF